VKRAEQSSTLADAKNVAVPPSRRGGYYENFENYRNGTNAEQKIAAHFAMTHRQPDKAAESFRAMLREAPRLALWAAGKHPQAFGEPSGREGPGITWRDVRALVSIAREGLRPVETPRDPLDHWAALAGERLALRDATARTRAKAAPEGARRTMARSLNQLAERIERQTATDPDNEKRIAHIRAVARNLDAGTATTPKRPRDEAGRIRGAAEEKDKVARYVELEKQLRQRDQARARHRSHDRDDGGQER
jgi:hypothetical protein